MEINLALYLDADMVMKQIQTENTMIVIVSDTQRRQEKTN
jgi:hypothetical protein